VKDMTGRFRIILSFITKSYVTAFRNVFYFCNDTAWLSLENAVILIDRKGGQIRPSGTEADPRQ
jgi:hypothetical protein